MSCTLIRRDSVSVDSQLVNETLALAYWSRRKVAPSAWLFSQLQRAKAEPIFILVLLLLLLLSTKGAVYREMFHFQTFRFFHTRN